MEFLRHLKVVGSTPTSGSIPVAAFHFCQHHLFFFFFFFWWGHLFISPPCGSLPLFPGTAPEPVALKTAVFTSCFSAANVCPF
jgi:hypothetical protein